VMPRKHPVSTMSSRWESWMGAFRGPFSNPGYGAGTLHKNRVPYAPAGTVTPNKGGLPIAFQSALEGHLEKLRLGSIRRGSRASRLA